MGALTWGTMQTGGGNGMAVGMEDHSGSGVDTNSTVFTWKVNIWTKNQYNYSGDTQTLTHSAGSTNYTNNEATGTSSMRVTISRSYTYTTYGSSPGSVATTASISGYYNTAMPTPSHSYSTAIPARPYAAPNAPGSVTNTRNSDTQATTNWTNSATAQKPITNHTIYYRTYTGAAWGAYASAGTSSGGTATSYAKTGLSANHIYQFEVRSNNSVGSSAFVAASAYVYMTPSAPTSCTATPNGANIDVTWASAAYTSSQNTHTVERSVDGGAYAVMATGIAQGTLKWTDTNIGSGSNTYRVKTVCATGNLSSAYKTSAATTPPDYDVGIWDGSAEVKANLYVWDGYLARRADVEFT